MLLRTNAKLQKSIPETARYLLTGLTLAPHSISGHNVCKGSSEGCRDSCNMLFSGLRVTPQARYAAIAQTLWLFQDRQSFLAQLNRDIWQHVRRAERAQLTPLIRLNMASDLDWFEVIQKWPTVGFFDYTKIRGRFEHYLNGKLPQNYHLTFSRHEKHSPELIQSFLIRGGNVAQVFDVAYNGQRQTFGDLPKFETVGGLQTPVIDGDKHDVRLPSVDGRGVIVGLRVKGTNAAKSVARETGFAR